MYLTYSYKHLNKDDDIDQLWNSYPGSNSQHSIDLEREHQQWGFIYYLIGNLLIHKFIIIYYKAQIKASSWQHIRQQPRTRHQRIAQ